MYKLIIRNRAGELIYLERYKNLVYPAYRMVILEEMHPGITHKVKDDNGDEYGLIDNMMLWRIKLFGKPLPKEMYK